jgi:BA14K-like protein
LAPRLELHNSHAANKLVPIFQCPTRIIHNHLNAHTTEPHVPRRSYLTDRRKYAGVTTRDLRGAAMTLKRNLLAAIGAAALGFGAAIGISIANAAPGNAMTANGQKSFSPSATPIQYRGRGAGFYGRSYGSYGGYYGRPYRRYGYGGVGPLPFIAGAVGAAIVGGAIYEGRAYSRGSDYERCAATFRSFNPNTGTYVTYGGEERVCPYLN